MRRPVALLPSRTPKTPRCPTGMPHSTDRRSEVWTNAAVATAASYRRMIDATVDQLTDAELSIRPFEDANSVAVLLRHLGGNLRSRWTDFLEDDGEKPDRDREAEFRDWPGDRRSLLSCFDTGWRCLEDALRAAAELEPDTPLLIRGERHTLAAAVWRSLTHVSYHTGQITLIGRSVHAGPWDWLTIAPGQSVRHNRSTWGRNASRGILGGGRTQTTGSSTTKPGR